MKTSKNCRKLWKNLEHKLIRLFRECLDGAKSCVKIGEYSQTFCLKQGDALSPVLSNLTIEKAVRAASGNAEVFDPKLILTYADDIGAIGESLKDNFIKVEKKRRE